MREKAQQIYQEAIVIDGHFAIELAMPGSLDKKFTVSLSFANDINPQREMI